MQFKRCEAAQSELRFLGIITFHDVDTPHDGKMYDFQHKTLWLTHFRYITDLPKISWSLPRKWQFCIYTVNLIGGHHATPRRHTQWYSEKVAGRHQSGKVPSDDWKASSVRRSSPSEHQYQYGRRMLENGATRQQIADVIGVGVKTIYKYFPAAVRDQGFLPFPWYVTFEIISTFSFENSLVCSWTVRKK